VAGKYAALFDAPDEPAAPAGKYGALFDEPAKAVDPRFVDDEPPARQYPDYNAQVAGLEEQRKALAAEPGFFGRAAQSIRSGAHAVKTVAKDVATHPIDTLGNPAKRRELERGVDDMVTLGYGQKLAARIGNALGDKPETALGPETFGGAPVANTQAADQAAAPEYRPVGQLAGAFIPGAAAAAGKAGGALAARLAPGAGILPGAVRGLAGYEATAPALAALGAGAEGHRTAAAEQAGGDPLGLLMSTAGGAAPEVPGTVRRGVRAVQDKATDAAAKWVTKDIGGEIKSASTPTARKQLADDAKSASRIVLADRELDKAISHAREGDIDDIGTARAVVKDRLQTIARRLSPGWADIDASLPQPLTSGDVVSHIEADAAQLHATGHTTDRAEAAALRAIAERLKTGEDWGATETRALDPKAEADLATLKQVRPNVKDPAAAAQVDQQISAIEATGAPRITFNPDHQIGMEQLQRLWSDEAGIAYDSTGGVNGTATFNRKLEVASHLRELRDTLLDAAAKENPTAVRAISGDLQDYSGLKHVDKVLQQRENYAKSNASGASVPAKVTRKIKEFKHSPEGVILAALPELGVAGMRWVQKAIARHAPERTALEDVWAASTPGAGATRAMAAGVPRQVALWAAQQAGRGVSFNDAVGQAP
jgi:hypothetical protein